MHLITSSLLALLPLTIATPLKCRSVEPTCPLIFDGRVPSTASLADFDTANGGGWMPFNPDYVKGQNLKWSSILLFPNSTAPSRFSSATTKPVEVTLSDQSIFMTQNGFRRAGLQFLKDNNDNSPAAKGKKTIHFSIQIDAERKLNTTHEYLLVWHETAAYDANQFNFETGRIIGQESVGGGGESWKLLDRNMRLLWSEPIKGNGIWENFAVTLDFDKNTLQMWYSTGDSPLQKVTEPLYNNNAGNGQYQIGMLKKPTGTSDVVNSGYQERNLKEGLIYGGIFIEDSASDCVSK